MTITAAPHRTFAAVALVSPALQDAADDLVIDLRDGVAADAVVLRRPVLARQRPGRAKAAFEWTAALLLLVLVAPVLASLALAITLTSGGPCWYAQARVGRNGRLFRCFKLRTMVRNADEVLRDLLDRDPAARAEFDRNWKLQDDPRVTRLGRFLRKTSLDELPQLVNVLKGEMALVGPRPIVAGELSKYGPHADEVFAVRPGLTGLWQVSGRNDLSYEERIELDLAYVRSSSVLFDLGIVARTAVQVLVPFRNGAC